MKIQNNSASIAHEASAGKISEEDIFYLQTRGLSADEATSMVVNGFIEPIVKQLPLEYAVEMNRLIEMEMEGSVG
jgi:Fe-S cluster assembly protein SufB